MDVLFPHTTRHLVLDDLVLNPKLARRLTPALAFRYHVLPVAEENSHITVAMANPDDESARQAVATALGAKLTIVQGDPTAIDGLLAEMWHPESHLVPRFVVHPHTGLFTTEMQAYSQYLGKLLKSQLSDFQTKTTSDTIFADLVEESNHGHELIIFGKPDVTLIEQLFPHPANYQPAKRLPISILITNCPRWPLKKILLITRGQGTDDIAVDWAVRLAQSSQATITVLAVVPPKTAMSPQLFRIQNGLTDWLSNDTVLGQQMNHLVQRLVNWDIKGTLRFRQGAPNGQIQCEVTEGNYDLIVMAAGPFDWRRRLLGELVSPLLRWVDSPVLVANPYNN